MTVDEAIEMYANNAEYERTHGSLQGCMDFRQLAEWLKDYKRLKEQEPCDAISRQAALECFTWTNDKADIWNRIKKLPSVTPQPKTEHWIEDTNGTYTDNHDTWECSGCGHAQILLEGTPKDNDYNYCPSCGAKMIDPQERSGKE